MNLIYHTAHARARVTSSDSPSLEEIKVPSSEKSKTGIDQISKPSSLPLLATASYNPFGK